MNQTLWQVEPEPDESCMSWVLRLCAANYLSSPWHLFRQAGLDAGNIGVARFDSAVFASISGADPHLLEPIACSRVDRRSSRVNFRGHTLMKGYVRNGQPQICPQCVEDRRLTRGIWDLHLVSACPVHRLRLLNRCPSCGHQLGWMRPGADLCKCKFELARWPREAATPEAIAVSAAIDVALTRCTEAWTSAVGSGNPLISAWARTPLSHVLASIRELARLSGTAHARTPICEHEKIVQGAGSILLDWPNAFERSVKNFFASRVQATATRSAAGKPASVYQMAHIERFKFSRVASRHGVVGDVLDEEFTRTIAGMDPTSTPPRTRLRAESLRINTE